ncbi:MAG: MBL fold metallo-hydrolase [Candidatus Eremiobacteraeota bacterium]|nr:MBL fold metallo-hydrolase [Candidatus Eremiobacteraeota bacterium]MBC5803823.1 MBL fold metallo-hydrolase [Candidatus Eremiobacteraeota bacterium]MBC5822413.1 MBL fold metallo-hydrolase [Candidatus Eremiobacteraeota bacterium]
MPDRVEGQGTSPVTVEQFEVGVLGCVCTIVADAQAREAIVVDGGDDVDEIVRRLDARGVRATQLVHTHAHVDHIGALAELRERTGGRGLLHPADLPLYRTLAVQARWLGLPLPAGTVAPDGDLREGDVVTAGTALLNVLHTPGHTPGSCSFALQFGLRTMLLTGDTLFAGAVGRWDIGGTSLADIVTSIREKLLGYPDDTIVVPGHGPATTIGIERRDNPYLQGSN